MNKNKIERRASVPIAIAIAVGMALWFAVALAAGRREAWDTSAYWTMAYPIAVGTFGVLGFAFPQRPWRWAAVLFLSQFAAMVLRGGELGSLWPLGLALFAVLSIPGMAAARFGSRLRARRTA